MLGAGILARNAVQKGLKVKPWVKTSLAPGLEGRDRVPRPGGTDRVPRGARISPRRLRVHDLHRQQRAAAGGDLRRGQLERPGGGLGAVGQPQLRGPDQPRREDELPRVAAAVRRLRARRDDGHRPLRRAARRGRSRPARVPEGHLAERRRGRRDDRGRRAVGHVPQELRRGVRRRRALELARGPHRGQLRVGRRVDVRAPAAVLRGSPARARADRRHRGRPGAGGARRQRHHRSHLAGRLDQARRPRRQVPDRARRASRATSTPTAPAAATTR